MPAIKGRSAPGFESDVAEREEVSDADIHLSRLTGMAPADIDVLNEFTRCRGLLIILRCPRRPAREFHGRYLPKPAWAKGKSNPETGLVEGPHGALFVSDYDLMSVWQLVGSHQYQKIFFSEHADGASLSPFAKSLLADVNWRLKSPFQHGAQDDYLSPRNRGVKADDRYMLFDVGMPAYLHSSAELETFYRRTLGDGAWPYDAAGNHRAAPHVAGPVAPLPLDRPTFRSDVLSRALLDVLSGRPRR